MTAKRARAHAHTVEHTQSWIERGGEGPRSTERGRSTGKQDDKRRRRPRGQHEVRGRTRRTVRKKSRRGRKEGRRKRRAAGQQI